MDRVKLRAINAAVATALAGVEAQFHIKVTFKGGSFNASNAVVRFEYAEVSASGVVVDKTVTDFKRFCPRYNLRPTDLNRTFTDRGITYTIIGAVPRSRSYPILCKRHSDNTRIRLSAWTVSQALTPTLPSA